MKTIELSPDEVARRAMQTPMQLRVTAAQDVLEKLPQIPCPLDHEFVKQFYIRTIHVPVLQGEKFTLVVSKIFKADFPFFLSKGRVSVWVEGQGVVEMQAPAWGFTKAGSRRVILCHEDVDWTTFHRTDVKNEEQAEAEVIYSPDKDSEMNIPAEALKELKGAL
jgi:hypothetical protein